MHERFGYESSVRALVASPALRTRFGEGARNRIAAYRPRRIIDELAERLQSHA